MAFSAYTNEWAAQIACYQLGINATISDVTTSPATDEEVVMNNVLQSSIRNVVNALDWAWLVRRVVLTEDTDADIEGWNYAYDIPDYERIIRIEPTTLSARNAREVFRYSFQFDYDIGGSDVKLVCDIPDAEMVYTARVLSLNTSPGSEAPHYFAKAVAAELASQAAMALLVDPQMAARSMSLAKEMLEEAIAAAQNTQLQSDDWPEADFIAARW